MRKYLAILLSCIMLVGQSVPIFAENMPQNETYEMVETDEIFSGWIESEISPSTLHISDIITSIVKLGSNKVGIRAETVCIDTVKSITVTYTLQKYVNNKWTNVDSKKATAYDTYGTTKSYTISGLGSGSYRAKASALVTDYNGYSETLTGYSSSISL